jgi:hypothetical protein
MGARDLIVPEEQVALRADALATVWTGAHLRRESGRAEGAAQKHEVRLRSKDRGGGAALEHESPPALRAGFRSVEDAGAASRAATYKQDRAFGTDPGSGRHRETAPWAIEAKGQAAGRAHVGLTILLALWLKWMSTTGAIDLAAARADAVVQIEPGAAAGTAKGVRLIDDRVR